MVTAEELKILRERQRRQERRARRAGLPMESLGEPRKRIATEGIRPQAPLLDPAAYEAQLAEALGFPIHSSPDQYTWMGYSLEYMRCTFPSPRIAAAKIEERLRKHGLQATYIALLPGIIGLGPVFPKGADPRSGTIDDPAYRSEVPTDDLPF